MTRAAVRARLHHRCTRSLPQGARGCSGGAAARTALGRDQQRGRSLLRWLDTGQRRCSPCPPLALSRGIRSSYLSWCCVDPSLLVQLASTGTSRCFVTCATPASTSAVRIALARAPCVSSPAMRARQLLIDRSLVCTICRHCGAKRLRGGTISAALLAFSVLSCTSIILPETAQFRDRAWLRAQGVELLVAAGCDVYARDSQGVSVLDTAPRVHLTDVRRALLCAVGESIGAKAVRARARRRPRRRPDARVADAGPSQ